MMYPFLTMNDHAEIVYSHLLDDGRVKIYVEKPDEHDGFHHAVCGIGYDYDAAVRKCQKLRGKKPRNDDVGEDAMVLAVKRGFEQAQAKANKPSSPGQNDDKEVNRYE